MEKITVKIVTRRLVNKKKVENVVDFEDEFNLDELTPKRIEELYKPRNTNTVLLRTCDLNGNEQYIPNLDYYFDDGVLKLDVNPLNVKLKDYAEYNIDINDYLELYVLEQGGIGGGGGEFVDLIVGIWEEANRIAREYPLLIDSIELILAANVTPFCKKFMEYLRGNLNNYIKFRKGVRHNEKYTLDLITIMLQAEEFEKESPAEYKRIINALMTICGFDYDEEENRWVLKR